MAVVSVLVQLHFVSLDNAFDFGGVQYVQDGSSYGTLGDAEKYRLNRRQDPIVRDLLGTASEERANPVEHIIRKTEANLQPLQQYGMIDAIKRCRHVEQAQQRNFPSVGGRKEIRQNAQHGRFSRMFLPIRRLRAW